MIEAKVIADSTTQQGKRLTTFQLRYPRFIHAEFMTHRTLSRNASSSRALPVAKLLEEVRNDALRAAPVFWGSEKKGMQTGDELPPDDKVAAVWEWEQAALDAAAHAEAMLDIGVHKSIVNRLLEPFSHINVVATATEWANFFGLRLDTAAEPTMRALAEAMWAAYNDSLPNHLIPGDWHLPYVDGTDMAAAFEAAKDNWDGHDQQQLKQEAVRLCIQVSVARCARVSYKSFYTGKQSTVSEDTRLYQKLVVAQPMHASPAEHQATPDDKAGYLDRRIFCSPNRHLWGNLVGWVQYRKTLPYESCAPLPRAYTGRD